LRVVNPGEEEGSDAASSRRASEDEKATEKGLEVTAEMASGVLVPVDQGPKMVREMGQELDMERVGRGLEVTEAERRAPSSSSGSSKGKGRVQEIVEKLEGWKD
jgi:hypothetical protein